MITKLAVREALYVGVITVLSLPLEIMSRA
jgi:hypothetical protein